MFAFLFDVGEGWAEEASERETFMFVKYLWSQCALLYITGFPSQ